MNRLVDDGMLVREPNTDHARSPLFDLTDRGTAAHGRLAGAQRDWISDLTAEIPAAHKLAASRVLSILSGLLASRTATADSADQRVHDGFLGRPVLSGGMGR